MKNKPSVLITGASDRIGKSIALFLAEQGYNIALHYNNSEEKAKHTKSEILEKNVKCEIFKADFNMPESLPVMLENVFSKFDLSILINNASIFYENDFKDSGCSHFDKFFNINFKSAYILSKEFANKVTNKSLIINILDTKITQNKTQHFDYLLTKRFLKEFTLLSAQNLAPEIRVNAIAPGLILPPEGKTEEYLNLRAKNIPLQKKGNLNNINSAVNFLITNDFITGQTIFVDGGENL